jgi:hypothetical protein
MGSVTMTPAPNGEQLVVDFGWAGAALEGDESGDLHAVVRFPDGALVAVVDGLGHGPEAAAAARAAACVLEAHAGEPVTDLVERCHEALRRTRGAVMTLASFDSRRSSMTWTAVGNVEAILLRASRAATPPREAILPRGGVVGYQLPPLRASTLPVSAGDTLILATDGIRSAFSHDPDLDRAGPQEIADCLLARYARGTDDALVLVARYLGEEP